jgi:hypothetical protein
MSEIFRTTEFISLTDAMSSTNEKSVFWLESSFCIYSWFLSLFHFMEVRMADDCSKSPVQKISVSGQKIR